MLEAQSRRLIEQYDLEAEKQRQIRDDVSLSVEERIAANERLGKVLDKQAEEEKKGIQARIDALRQQVALEGESHELTAQIYDLNTELLAVDAKVAGFRSEQLTNETGLKQELLDLDAARQEGVNQLAIAEENYYAEAETNELNRLYAKQAALEKEQELELKRLEDIKNNAAEGTQARIDAENAYNTAKQQFGFDQMTLDKAIADQKQAQISQTLDMAINAAGAEGKVGRALFLVKQALALKELIMNAKNTLTKSVMNAAESGTDLAKGSAKAASSAPPPANLIPIAMFALQAAGIVMSIKQALTKSKQAASGAGVSGGGGASVTAPTTPTPTAPAFNIVGQGGSSQLAEAIGGQSQQPLRAFVVSNDVTSAQSLDRNIIETTSL